MRVILAAGIGLIALTVSGCDINTTPKTAKVDCNCTVPPPAPPAGMRGSDAYPPPPPPEHDGYDRYRGHRDHRYARGGGHSYYWRREYAEMSVFTYDYHSHSTSYDTGGHGGGSGGASAYAYAAAGAYAGGGAYAGAGTHAEGGDGYHVVEHGWRDGYGRMHDGETGDPAHYETGGDAGHGDTGGGADRARLHPWHGYDADCPDPANHH